MSSAIRLILSILGSLLFVAGTTWGHFHVGEEFRGVDLALARIGLIGLVVGPLGGIWYPYYIGPLKRLFRR